MIFGNVSMTLPVQKFALSIKVLSLQKAKYFGRLLVQLVLKD